MPDLHPYHEMDVFFRQDAKGRYWVFCADGERLCKMKGKPNARFLPPDIPFHAYSVCDEDDESDAAFQAFRKDESGRLHPLRCIDRFDEVWACRRTWRCHAASAVGLAHHLQTADRPDEVLWDARCAANSGWVNNFNHMHSMVAIQGEMADAVLWVRQNGEGRAIACERMCAGRKRAASA